MYSRGMRRRGLDAFRLDDAALMRHARRRATERQDVREERLQELLGAHLLAAHQDLLAAHLTQDAL